MTIDFHREVKKCPHLMLEPCIQGECQLWVTYVNSKGEVFAMCSEILRTLLTEQQIVESICITATLDTFKNEVFTTGEERMRQIGDAFQELATQKRREALKEPQNG